MPVHTRTLNAQNKIAVRLLTEVLDEVYNDLEGMHLTAEQTASTRIDYGLASVATIAEQAAGVRTVVQQHHPDIAAPILRSMQEAQLRLEYALLGKGNNRIIALKYNDCCRRLDDYKDTKAAYEGHAADWPNEPAAASAHVMGNIDARISEIKEIKEGLLEELVERKTEDYLVNGKVDKQAILKAMRIDNLSNTVDEEKKQQGLMSYARVNIGLVYPILSQSVHASTIAMATMVTHTAAEIHLNAVEDEDIQRSTTQALAAAYALTTDAYLDLRRELGLESDDHQARYAEVLKDNFL